MQDRIFRALMRLLPAEFRGDYGREMENTFRAERRAATNAASVARLWMTTIADVVRTAPSEHLDILRRDLAYTLRMLGRRKALTITATLTLALGIGANTAIFSVVNGVLLSPLPYPEPERLVQIQEREVDAEPGTTGYYSFDQLRLRQGSFDWIAAMGGWSATLTADGGNAERVNGARVSWEFFRALGIRPALGRDFERAEDQPARRRVLLLSDQLWRRRFNADPSVVGRPTRVNGVDYTIVGVMPASLREIVTTSLYPKSEVWTLLGYAVELPQACRSCRHIQVVGRLRAGVSPQQAEADLSAIYQSLSTEFPSEYGQSKAVVTPVRDRFLGPVKPALLVLWGAVGVLLVMTCANIANLLLMRASERDEEMAIRRAMGVTPSRLLRQLITEAVVLAMLGGAAGVLLAWWGTTLLTTHGPEAIPRLRDVSVNGWVLLYAVVISLVTGVVFGLAPARMLIGRGGSPAGLKARHYAGPEAWRYRATLLTANVALSVLLLIGSGLLVRSFMRLLTVDPGFNAQPLLTMRVALSGTGYAERPAIDRFYQQLSERLTALPGVSVVSGATQIPLTGSIDRSGIRVEGRSEAPQDVLDGDRYAVLPGFFDAMQIRLLRGRLLEPTDGAGAPPVVVISNTMAERLWPGEDAIGRRITVAGGPDNPRRTIVGIVSDTRHYGLHAPPTLQVYMPHAQTQYPESMLTMVLRAKDGQDPLTLAPEAREAVRAIDPLQPVSELQTYSSILDVSMATRRFTLVLFALFASTALVLAIVGLYGALSFVVSQRHKEIGLRLALGAGARDIRRLVLDQGMRPAVAGLVIGLSLSALGTRFIEAMLYGVASTDLATFVGVPAVVGMAAIMACLVPAARAARIDPATTLRSQ
jgi:putative ABC transport system permease protein